MKFAKELEQELVPEWRVKYLNYKVGKKKIKTIARALKNVEQSPWTSARRNRGNTTLNVDQNQNGILDERPSISKSRTYSHSATAYAVENDYSLLGATDARATPGPSDQRASPLFLKSLLEAPREQRPLKSPNLLSPDHAEGYGSIAPAPSQGSCPAPSSLELPGPALDPNDGQIVSRNGNLAVPDNSGSYGQSVRPEATRRTSLYGVLPSPKSIFRPRGDSNLDQSGHSPRPTLKQRMASSKSDRHQYRSPAPPEAFSEVRIREAEFFDFLDKELAKIESFYKMKEEEASERLSNLKSQLHLMHDARVEDLRSRKQPRDTDKKLELASTADEFSNSERRKKPRISLSGGLPRFSESFANGTTKEALSGPGLLPRLTVGDENRDYVRRQAVPNVPYRSAKRKLKSALLEFYRGLELLKAYADLNRKAFRKMNKKYDKVVNARPTGRYMSEKVNKSWFVQSDAVENHLAVVEDLYTRYFERGNRKIAVGKLRGKTVRVQDHSPSAFRNGLMCAAGLVLGIQGLVYAIGHLNSDDDDIRARTSYLLQIYGGYFLVVFHVLLFCLDCMIWSGSKINYAFVFEFDARHVLDWRQLAEIPCFFVFLEGLVIWLNFRRIDELYVFFPVFLIAATVVILFLPARILYHRSRAWWTYSNWRLIFAGLYPVEFRDFFMGDMYCSQTYAMGNLSLFFCLYSRSWDDPGQCNSSHSRLMGFLTALPSIWRGLQCIRRYRDTKDKFPHIVNLGKYTCSVLYYMSFSLYRIERTHHLRAIFVICACLNAMYTSIWDLAMDWSLGNPYSKHPFLRDFLAFRRRWVYYTAMIIDPILRFTWVFYVIFTYGVQHSALLSFAVSFLEVGRRGMWSIFRVENEHCTNVCRFRASRDVPLPYDLSLASQEPGQESGFPPQASVLVGMPATATGVDVERAADISMRNRRASQVSDGAGGTLSRVGNMLANAHAQDFERRRSRSMLGKSPQPDELPQREADSSTEDGEEEEDDDEPDILEYPLQVGDGNLFEETGGHPHQR